MRAHCVLVATTLLHSGAKFHFFLYTGSKTVRVNMESCYGGMSTRLKQRAMTEEGDQFLFNIVTGNESWIHHFDPEEKRLSMQYRHTSSPRPKKFKTMPSAGKILLTVFFWDSQRLYMTEFLEAGNTVNSARYIETIKPYGGGCVELGDQHRGFCCCMTMQDRTLHAQRLKLWRR